jgi:AAA15 family ATPase/GTPase
MLTNLMLKGFKSWNHIPSMRLAPITGLFGTNSSGKSSLIQFFLMLKQTVESTDRSQVLNLGDERSLVSLGTYRDVIHQHAEPGKLIWHLSSRLPKELKIRDPEQQAKILFKGNELEFRVKITENGSGRVIVTNMDYYFGGYGFSLKRKTEQEGKYDLSATPDTFRFSRRTRGRAWDLPAPVKCYGFPDQVKAYYKNAGFLADFELAFEQMFSRLYYLGPLREYPKRQYTWAGAQPADMGHRGEKAIDALLASRERGKEISRGKGRPRMTVEEYVAWWLSELKMIDVFSVEAITKESNLYQVWVRKSPMSSKVLITDVGFGLSQLLPVIVLCYYVPEGSTILLEQPELHLHPSVQSGLADVFIDAVKNRHIQIIIESHSEHLLRRLQRRIAEEEVSRDHVALYFCDMSKGVSKLRELELDLWGNIINWPANFFGDEFGEMAAMTQAAMKRKKRQNA